MTEQKSTSSNVYQGGGHFEFSSEKNWGIEQDDCKIFDSIDMIHLADSVASLPFHVRHNIPSELFTAEQLEEFEVEASLALSRYTFQCNSKSKLKTEEPTSVKPSQTPETNKLMKLILHNFSGSDGNVLDDEIQPNEQLDDILGNMKPLINILEDETNITSSTGASETDSISIENQVASININSEIGTSNQDSGHWLDSMLDSDE